MSPQTLAPAIILTCLVACRTYDPLYCDPDRPCTDPIRSFCDLEGTYPASEGIGRTCIPEPEPSLDADVPDAPFCTAGDFVSCTDEQTAVYCDEAGASHVTVECPVACDADRQGCYCEPETSSCTDDQSVHCGADGRVEEIEFCPLGCDGRRENCIDVNPSNGVADYLDMTDDAPVVVLTSGAIIDTDDGTIEDGDGATIDVPDFELSAPVDGVPLRVFAVKSISMSDTLIRGVHAAAIVSDGDIAIHGHVKVQAGEVEEGPCVGQMNTCMGFVCGGIGGGGFGTRGGAGGMSVAGSCSGEGGQGGSTSGNAAMVPLRGGCGGINGGHGGGAIQLVSRTRILVEDGAAEASLDAGGRPGANNGAGASGGGILLEAPRVAIVSGAALVANGSGGGSGIPCTDGVAAGDGSLTNDRAPGGTCSISGEAEGGAGASRIGGATDGRPAAGTLGCNSISMGGDGGGGTGRIRVNVPTGLDFSQGGVVSPFAVVGPLATR